MTSYKADESKRTSSAVTSSDHPSPTELFRPEVLKENFGQQYGALRLAQPLSNWVISAGTSVFILLFLSYICWGELPKKVSVIGIIQPVNGSLGIIAANSGILVRTLAREGDIVRSGEPIFEISTERQGSIGSLTGLLSVQLQNRKVSLNNEKRNRILQDSEKRSSLTERISSLESQERLLLGEIKLAEKRKKLAEETVEKYVSLQLVKFASSAQLQEKQESLIDLDGRLSGLLRSKTEIQSSRLELMAQRKALASGLESDMIQLNRLSASLEQEVIENENRRSSFIVAPTGGRLTSVTYKDGQGVLAGQVLATVVSSVNPENSRSELEIHLYAPSRTTGFIAAGQIVELRYQAFPYQKFGLHRGTITSVGDTPFAPNEIPSNVAATVLNNAQQSALGLTNNEALYRIVVKPDSQYIEAYGGRKFLKSGMSLDADIIQEKRHIWEWIIEPIRALRGH